MNRPILIHIHVPKTAGTTLNFVLGEAFGEHRQFLCALPEHALALAAQPQDERDRTDFIFGHYPYGLHALFARPVLYMACLREPRQRILSFHRFVLSHDHHPLHDAMWRNGRDFSAFLRLCVEDPGMRDPADNVQVRMLAGDMGLRLDDDYDDRLAKALINITADNFLVGDMRDVNNLLDRLANALHLTFGPIPRLNVSEDSASFDDEMRRLDPEARDTLDRFVKWDTILYRLATTVAQNGRPQM